MRKILLVLFIVSISSTIGFTQNFSNKGKEFFLCFPNHVQTSNTNQATLSIFITSDQASSGTVTMTNGFFSATFSLTSANGFFQEIQILPVPGIGIPPTPPTPSPAQIFSNESNIVGQKSIKVAVNSGQPSVVVYAQQWAGARTAATLVLPSNVLGKKYIATSYTQNGSSLPNSTTHLAKSQFQVIAVKPNTTVQVTPRFNGAAQPPFTISLPNIGDIYQYQPSSLTNDITGTLVESIASGTSGCLPIAVFSGSSNLTVGGNLCNGGSFDPLWQQMYPTVTWGKKYGYVPFALYNNGNFYRVIASEANTQVFVNGVLVTTLVNIGDIYPNTFNSNPVLITTPSLITSDKPIAVAHYAQAQACAGGQTNLGDPDMVILNSIEQSISDITVFSSNTQSITNKFINILIPTNGIPSFRLSKNGGPLIAPLGIWQNFAALPGYSYIKENIETATTRVRLLSDSGFNAIAYGFGVAESYAYSAGTNVIDFNQGIGIQSQYGIINNGSTYSCSNSPFSFNIYLPESVLSNSGPFVGTNVPIRYDSMRWEVTNNASAFVPNNFPRIVTPGSQTPPGVPLLPYYTNPVLRPDSITIRNGRSVAWYSLPAPNQYGITTPGTYNIKITGYRTNNNGDGCASGNETEFNLTLNVVSRQPASFTYTQPGCPADSVRFTETTPQNPQPTNFPTYNFWWNFGDPSSGAANTSFARNPTHPYANPGTYTVRFANITTPGCLSDTTSQDITVPGLVNATISGTTAVCQNSTPNSNITFTITPGPLGLTMYKIKYTLSTNGGAPVAQPDINTNVLVNTIPAPTGVAGTYTYNITSIENPNAAFCTSLITGQSATVTVNPLPTAIITGTTTVCQNAASPDIIFTGSNGTAPYTFSYTINGGPVLTIQTISGNSRTLPVPTNATGTFIYELVSVTDGSSTLCSQSATGNATVIVQATSTATISGTATVCQNGTLPIITFTAANGNAPFEFTYNINGGAPQTISTVSGPSPNTATLTVPMTSTGTFVYNLTGVSNSGTIVCFTPITGSSATVIINPVPSATISGNTTVCQNSPFPSITFTGSGATMPYTFNYTINNIAQTPVFTTNPSTSVTVPVSTAIFGAYVYALTSVTDGSSTACSNTVTGTATVNVNELPTATISGTTTVCQAGTSPNIIFTANGGAPPYTFSYTLNSSPFTATTTVGNSVPVPVSTATPGTFTYTLISVQESSAVACLQNQTGSAVVTVHPKPTASFTTVGPYCSQLAVTFTPAFGITPTGSVVSWVWDYDNGTGPQVRPNGNPFTVTYATAGIKNVTFKTISDNGCESVVYPMQVTINSKPVAAFINPAACLADANAQFYDNSTVAGAGASIVYWEWDFGDNSPIYAGSTPAHKNPVHAYSAVGQKTVTLTVTTNSGCKDTKQQSFFINGEVTRAAFTTLNPTGLCSNRPVQIRENSIVNVGGLIRTDIYWDYVGAPTAFDQDNNPTPNKIYTHNYPNLQTDQVYSIRYFAYSGFNGVCQKDTIINITVRASPVAVFLPVPDVCLNGGPIVLTQGSASGGTGVYIGPGVSFVGGVWIFDPLAANVGTNNIVNYKVTSAANCDSTRPQSIKVLAPPVVNSFAPVGNICNTRAVTFHNTYTNGDGTVIKWIYNWMDSSPLQTMTTSADVTHVYNTSGPHTATLTLETGYGCRNIPFLATFTVNPLPIPTYTYSTSVCLPAATVVFTNTTGNQAENNYVWSFELPSTSAANTSTLPTGPSHTYTSQGPFSTNLVATNIVTGCTDTSATIVINSNTIHPAPVLQFSTLADRCLNNGTVSFATFASETSGIPGGPGIFTSTIPGAITANGLFNPFVAGAGIHTITYTWTSSFNCPAFITQNVKVLDAPVVNTFTTMGNRCETNSIIFQNTVTQGAGTINTWIYDWGDNSPLTTAANGNDITHTYALAGTYPATLYVVTDGGCKSAPALFLSVVVNPLPRPNFTYTDTTCLPQAKVIFVNTTPNISDWTYNWNFDFPSTNPADQSTQAQNVPYTYTTFGPHNVKLIATSGLTGCTDFITKPITSIHKAPLASFNISKPTICVNQTLTVTNNSTTPDGTITSWLWNYGDNTGTVQGQVQPPHTYTAPGTDSIRLTIINSFGCKDDSVRAVIIYPYPVVDAGPDQFVLEGGSTVLQATATGNLLTYSWTASTPLTYLNRTDIIQPVSTPVTDVTYKLTVTAQGGCPAFDSVFVKVLKMPAIPNTFTPNNDGIHDFWDIKYLNSYPQNRVQVFTRQGKLVFESKGYPKPWDGNMNGKSLPIDTYYYIIEPGNGRKALTGFVTIVK